MTSCSYLFIYLFICNLMFLIFNTSKFVLVFIYMQFKGLNLIPIYIYMQYNALWY